MNGLVAKVLRNHMVEACKPEGEEKVREGKKAR